MSYKGKNGRETISHRIDSATIRQDILGWMKYRNGLSLDGVSIPKKVESAIGIIKSMYVKLGIEKQAVRGLRKPCKR